MKTKMLLLAALVGAAAMSANAGVRFGFSIGLPLPVVVSTPVVYATPVTPAPMTVVQTVPPCLSVDYVWAPGYWSYGTTGHVWVPGAWFHRPAHVVYGHYYAGRRW
jgi:hypothetical protein